MSIAWKVLARFMRSANRLVCRHIIAEHAQVEHR